MPAREEVRGRSAPRNARGKPPRSLAQQRRHGDGRRHARRRRDRSDLLAPFDHSLRGRSPAAARSSRAAAPVPASAGVGPAEARVRKRSKPRPPRRAQSRRKKKPATAPLSSAMNVGPLRQPRSRPPSCARCGARSNVACGPRCVPARAGTAHRRRCAGNPDPEEVQRSVAQLVLTIVEFLRQLMERQATRRMEQKTLTKRK